MYYGDTVQLPHSAFPSFEEKINRFQRLLCPVASFPGGFWGGGEPIKCIKLPVSFFMPGLERRTVFSVWPKVGENHSVMEFPS